MIERKSAFRRGENKNKPWGGNIADKPLPKAFWNLAFSRGYDNQVKIAKSLNIYQNSISCYLRQKTVLSPLVMSKIFQVYQPNPEEVESLIKPWSDLLQEKKEKRAPRNLKQGKTPISNWLRRYAFEHKITLDNLAEKLKVHNFSTKLNRLSVDSMGLIIENASQALRLDERQTAELAEAVAQTIEEKVSEGHQFKRNSWMAKITQKSLPCVTYTPQDAANEFGISRQAVHLKRKRLGLRLLMNEEEMAILRMDFEATRAQREKCYETQRKNLRNQKEK